MKKNMFHPIIQRLLIVFTSYFFTFVLVFSTYLQTPITKGEQLMLGLVVEQSISWIFPLSAIYFLYLFITNHPLKKSQVFSEKYIRFAMIVTVMFTGMGVGVHAAAEIVTAAINDPSSYAHQVGYFLDEIIGHGLMLPVSFVGISFSLLELNRKTQKTLNTLNLTLLNTLAVLNGVLWAIGNIEGGSMHVVAIPTGILSLLFFIRILLTNKLKLPEHPYTQYFLTTTIVMILVSVLWVVSVGAFTQLTDLNFELLNL